MTCYGADLAYIHDAGHSGYALGAAPGLLRILRAVGVKNGLVVDLGCGSGRWARELNRGGYQVLGIDRSPDLIRLARKVAPESRFVVRSLWNAALPDCDAVTAIGECLNYAPSGGLRRLFARIFRALRPGGVFVFDAAGPSRIPAEGTRRNWSEGRDWAVLVETTGDPQRNRLNRRIVTFRKIGARYRRGEELHQLRLHHTEDLMAALSAAGFRAETRDRFGRFLLPEGITGFICDKGIT